MFSDIHLNIFSTKYASLFKSFCNLLVDKVMWTLAMSNNSIVQLGVCSFSNKCFAFQFCLSSIQYPTVHHNVFRIIANSLLSKIVCSCDCIIHKCVSFINDIIIKGIVNNIRKRKLFKIFFPRFWRNFYFSVES